MGYKVDMSGAKAKIRAICTDDEVGQYAAEDVARLATQYVPMYKGILRGSVEAEPFLVTWSMPYAHYQWAGISKSGRDLNYSKSPNPNATSHWEQHIDKDELARDITEFLRRL